MTTQTACTIPTFNAVLRNARGNAICVIICATICANIGPTAMPDRQVQIKVDSRHMLSHQIKWWELGNYIRLLTGGKGCGKTYIGALRAIWLSFINSPCPGQCVCPTYPVMDKSVIPTFREIFAAADVRYEYNENKHRIHIPSWDGHIWLGSGEVPESLVGPNLAWAWIDEPFLQKKLVFLEMLARVRHPLAKHREIFLTGTPEELNWGYDLATKSPPFDGMDVGVVYGRTRDNWKLPLETIESMEQAYTPEMLKAYMEGQFVLLTAGRVYSVFDRGRHLKANSGGNTEGLPIVAGIDFNVDYMSAEIAIKGPTWLHFFDEIRLSNANTFELAEALKVKYPGIAVYPDPTGKARKSSSSRSDHDILRQAGFSVYAHKGSPPVRERVNAVNRMLLNDNLTMDNCPHLVVDMERNIWKSGDIDKSQPELTHAADALGYMIEYLYPVRKLEVSYTPRFGGREESTPERILREQYGIR